MLKVNKLIELIEIANEQQKDFPIGTIFEYKNNLYVVKKTNEETINRKGCELEKEFLEELKYESFGCGDECPFGYLAVPVKLSEIETLILKGDANEKI